MKCEICDEQTATMWVEGRLAQIIAPQDRPILSCADCGPQLGYKVLAPLEPTKAHTQKLLGSS